MTAQYGLGPDPQHEPMNRKPVTPTLYIGGAPADNRPGGPQHLVSGFRSQHHGGCNFVFADGGVRFMLDSVPEAIYRALSTYVGGEAIPEGDI